MRKKIGKNSYTLLLSSVLVLLISSTFSMVYSQADEFEESTNDFYVILPEIVEVSQGSHIAMEVVVYPIGEYNWNVSLIADIFTIPEGVEVNIEPERGVPPAVFLINVTASLEAEVGTSIITIEAQGLDPSFLKHSYATAVKVKEKIEEEKYDLTPVLLKPIQVTKTGYSHLALGKNTVFEVGIFSTFPGMVMARIKLVFESFDRQEYVTDPLPFRGKNTTYYILPLKDDLDTEQTGTGAYTPIAIELLNAPKPNGKPAGVNVEVDPDNRIEEKDETNNKLPRAGFQVFPVRDFAALTLMYTSPPLLPGNNFTSLLGAGPPYQLELYAAASTEFILGTYPIADREIDYRVSLPPKLSYLQKLGKGKGWTLMINKAYYEKWFKKHLSGAVSKTTDNWVRIDLVKAAQMGLLNASKGASTGVLWYILYRYSNLALKWSTAQHQYRYVVVFPQSYLNQHFHSSFRGILGFMYPNMRGAVYASVTDICAPAHEIGHTYGLRLDKEEYNNTYTGNKGIGFWVNKYKEIDTICRHDLQLDHPRVDPLYCFMGSQIGPNCWVCNDDYRWLQGNYTHSDPEVLLVNGIIYQNGTTYLFPFHRIEDSSPSITLGTTGNYYIALIGSEGQLLGKVGFNATFEIYVNPEHIETDFEPFMFTIPWIEGTSQIQIIDETGSVLASRTVSSNPPQVTIISPKGGETFYTEGEFTIELETSDPDGDPVSIDILYSTDNGETWQPLIVDISSNRFEWDLNELYIPPSEQYLIQIIASDGVNSVQVSSDSTFTVAEGSPTLPMIPGFPIEALLFGFMIATLALIHLKKKQTIQTS